jgi:hypothetical protein
MGHPADISLYRSFHSEFKQPFSHEVYHPVKVAEEPSANRDGLSPPYSDGLSDLCGITTKMQTAKQKQIPAG